MRYRSRFSRRTRRTFRGSRSRRSFSRRRRGGSTRIPRLRRSPGRIGYRL